MTTTPQQSDVRELVIVGSGPAGYTAAIYAARAGLAPLVVAGSVTAGGALMNTTEVENFPGWPDGIQGPELMENLQKQAERFGAEVLWDDAVSLSLDGPVKTIEVSGGETFRAKAVILATGSAYRELGLDDEKRLSGRGVSWCATCDGFFFKDQDILVVGGGYSAVEEATFLTRFGKSVTIVHRRDQLRASKIMADRAVADVGLATAADQLVGTLSGGQRSRASLACALVGEPELVVADEPTTLLDARNTRVVAEHLGALAQQLVIVTHQLELVEGFDRVLVVDEGRIVADDEPAAALASYRRLVA